MKQTDVQRKVAAATGLLWPKRNDQDTDAPASLLLIIPGGAVRVLSLGRRGKLPSATAGDPPQEIIVGSLGDFPRGGRLRYLDAKSFGNVYILVKSSTIDGDFPFTVGKSFTKKDAQDNFAFLCNFMKDDNASYTIVIVPTTIWLPFGHEPPRGDNADTIHCTLESIHPHYSLWVTLLTESFIPLLAVELSNLNNQSMMQPSGHLPKLTRGHSVSESPITTLFPLGDQEEEEIKATLTKMETQINEVATYNLAQMAKASETAKANASSMTGRIPKVVTAQKKTPAADDDDCNITLSTRYTEEADDKPSSKELDKARRVARMSILLFCKTNDTFHGPVYTEDFQEILDTAGAKDRYQQLSQLHQSDDDDDDTAEDDGFATVLSTVVDPPKVSGVAWALFLSGDFQTKPLQDLKELTGKVFGFGVLLPTVGKHSDSSRGTTSADTLQAIQLAMGEDKTRLASVETSISCATAIDGMKGANAYLANVMRLLKKITLCEGKIEVDGVKQSAPVLYVIIKELYKASNTLLFRRQVASDIEKNPYIPYFLFACVDRIASTLAMASTRSRIMRAIKAGDFSALKPVYAAISNLKDKFVTAIEDYGSGGPQLDPPAIWANSEAKRRIDAVEQRATELRVARLLGNGNGSKRGSPPALGDTQGPPKRQTTQVEIADKDGDIICTDDIRTRMIMPTITNPNEQPCPGHYRKGSKCGRGAQCKLCHTPIDKLTNPSKAEWKDHVANKDNKVYFNPKRVKTMGSNLIKNQSDGDQKPAAEE